MHSLFKNSYMIIFLIGVWFALAPTWFIMRHQAYYDLLPWTSEKTERSGVINNSEIKFLKHNNVITKNMHNHSCCNKESKSWNSELFSLWFYHFVFYLNSNNNKLLFINADFAEFHGQQSSVPHLCRKPYPGSCFSSRLMIRHW